MHGVVSRWCLSMRPTPLVLVSEAQSLEVDRCAPHHGCHCACCAWQVEFNKAAQSLSDSHFSPEQKKQAQGRLMKARQLSACFAFGSDGPL